MRSWVNYHSHTNYCDGTAPPETYVVEAIERGLPAYGYSSHAPVPFLTDWNIADKQLNNYIEEIQSLKTKYQNDIQVYLGLEIDFIPGNAGRTKHTLKDIDLDYFIGSIHCVDNFSNGDYWIINDSLEIFRKGLKDIFNNDFRKASIRFWEIARQMIEEDQPDVIGHLDLIKIYNKNDCYFSETETWYTDQVELTLDLIKKKGCIVEINTRGYYRYCQPDLYPGEAIIKLLTKKEIPMMINSDAHKPDELTEGMEYAAGILKKHGVGKLAALYSQKWNEYPFTKEGIILY